jgi:hypothetical protein
MFSGRNSTAALALALVMGCSSEPAGGGGAGGQADGGAVTDGSVGLDRGLFPDASSTFEGGGGSGTQQGGGGSSMSGQGGNGAGGVQPGSGGAGQTDGPVGDARVGDGPDSDAKPTGPGTCANPITLPSNVAHAEEQVNTTGGSHAFDLPCAANGADVVLSFTLTQRELVYADTFGSAWNTVLYFSSTCGTSAPSADIGTVACSDDACGSSQSQAVAVLGYGRHYLVVSGAKGETGAATVHFQHVPVGNGPLTLLPAGDGTRMGVTSGDGIVNDCEAAGPDNSYWWKSCPDYAGGTLTASTCHGAMFDTVLSLQIPRTSVAACGDDDPTCGIQSTLSTPVPPGAGIQVLTVDSNTGSNAGEYTLTYSRP